MNVELSQSLIPIETFFINRSDTYTKQNENGSYTRIEHPLTTYILKRHLDGEITIGAYQLDKNNAVKYLCFDLDPEHLDDPKETARKILDECINKPTKETPRFYRKSVLLEASRYPDQSYHIWVLFTPSIPAKVARWLGLKILEHANINPKTVEVFPKQEELTKDLPFGNLVKLPLGFHRREKKWSKFLDLETFALLPNEVVFDIWGISFSEADMEKIMSFSSKREIQTKFELPKDFKPLPDEEEERSARWLAKYWLPGYRNDLEISFLGLCLKRGVSFESAYAIIDQVCNLTNTTGNDRRVALEKVKYHYEKRRSLGSKLKASSGLRGVIKDLIADGLAR